MAAVSFQQKIALDLRALLSAKKLANWSNQDDTKDSEGDPRAEDTDRTLKVAHKAAGRVLFWSGPLGDFDDGAEPTDAERAMLLELGTRIALFLYSQLYSVTLTETGRAWIGDWAVELTEYRTAKGQEAFSSFGG